MKKKIEIQDNIDAAVNYRGCVTIKYLDKFGRNVIKEAHNEAKMGLFTAVSRALAGFDTNDYVPRFLMGYYGEDEALAQKIGYTSAPVTYNNNLKTAGNNNNAVEYTFMIPLNALVQRGAPINYLRLFNKRGDECAFVELSEGIATDISSNILISWKLKFFNAEVAEV